MMLLQDKKTRSGNCCLSFSCWLFSLATWASLATLIISAITNNNELLGPSGGIFAFCYIVYLILEFCSPTCSYLMNKQGDQGMYSQMGKLFSTPPVINFYADDKANKYYEQCLMATWSNLTVENFNATADSQIINTFLKDDDHYYDAIDIMTREVYKKQKGIINYSLSL